MVGIPFEEFLHFFFIVLTLEVANDFFVADGLEGLHLWGIALSKEAFDLLDESDFQHFFDTGIDELVGGLFVSSQTEHQERMTNGLLDEALGFCDSGAVVDFKRSDEVSGRVGMEFLGFIRVDAREFSKKEARIFLLLLFKLASQG